MTDQAAGIGSTLVLLELHDCCADIAGNPSKLHETMRQIIDQAGLTAREASLDYWNTPEEGPSTSYHTLAESHICASAEPQTKSLGRVRAEAWTEEHHNFYVNADFQVCNYSKLNKHIPEQMAQALLDKLSAKEWQMTIIQRGPGCPMRILQTPVTMTRKKAA